jgi:hypothetical protein
MKPKIMTIMTLLIGVGVGITLGAFVLGPLILKPNCQPETIVLSHAYVYSNNFFVTVQNAGPGAVTLSSYGVSSSSPTYTYSGTTFTGPTANPAIGAGTTITVWGNMGPSWTNGAPTTITIVTSCNNKFSAQIGY